MTRQKTINYLGRDMWFTSLASLLAGVVTALLLGLLVFIFITPVEAAESLVEAPSAPLGPDQVRRGSLLLRLASGGVAVDAPLLHTDVQMQVGGMLARVTVRQRFHNPGTEWVEGTYVFPLPEDAAVDRMRLRIGERLIEGEIQEKEAARKTYEAAKRSGRKASLLSQERPNIFTTVVANIAPGEIVQVEIEYQQTVAYRQGEFRLRFPLVVAPRYIPGEAVEAAEVTAFQGSGWASDTAAVPDASRITPPVVDPREGPVNPVSIGIRLDAGMPLSRLESVYHPMRIESDAQAIHHLTLQAAEVPADRDFELLWVPEPGDAPRAALFSESWQGDEYALLMLMPPDRVNSAAPRIPREVIYVIDTSGSMHGDSIIQARAALQLALQRLDPADRFNVIQFNHRTAALFPGAVAADPGNLRLARQYVEGLTADGGTEMLPALQLALGQQAAGPKQGVLRQIVFLTDGSVGNEQALFGLIHRQLGDSRLFTVGIGSAPNSFFMTRAAQFGRGTFTYIGKVAEVAEKMAALFARLETPRLTDIEIRWPQDQPVEMWPARIPDLYQGEPVLVVLKMAALKMAAPKMAGAEPRLELAGDAGGTPWRQQATLRGGAARAGVHQLWARRKIADLMDRMAQGEAEAGIRQAVLDVALPHRLVSRYTSLVAVDKTPSRPADQGLSSKALPTDLPQGWSAAKVFGSLPQTATASEWNLLLGTLLLIGGLLISRWSTLRAGLAPCMDNASADNASAGGRRV
ncbi:marine proteobacterial sortase target protein [Sedimenticola hydrogenitrophicus]|uniref:marine proteobacterial sortase target protein n=1 Tax=Sedimenticola hydrogenitrophicus TaxID=2967975 RepID=UPI0021A7770F|nr:marine proteobacterial sortase target protein [Sedimenticola hydrogenitrophicus]